MTSESSPDAAGVQFSEEKGGKHIAPLSIGEGILGQAKKNPVNDDKTEKHLDKANSLLDEMSREERSGFKAEIGGLGHGSSEKLSNLDNSAGGKTKSLRNKRNSSDDDNYDDDFIDEDIAHDDRDDIEDSGNLH